MRRTSPTDGVGVALPSRGAPSPSTRGDRVGVLEARGSADNSSGQTAAGWSSGERGREGAEELGMRALAWHSSSSMSISIRVRLVTDGLTVGSEGGASLRGWPLWLVSGDKTAWWPR